MSRAAPISGRPGYRGKRALDVALSIISAPMWVPAMLAVGIAVRLAHGKPVLFQQERVGANDIPFRMLKFRTMRDAVGRDGKPLPDDARLTKFGRWLRSTSLDELPEIINVLRGDMSLVGPRPLLPEYLQRYSAEHRRRHAVRPGLTGLAQVRGRNRHSWMQRLDLDVEYVDSVGLRTDLRILAETIQAVVLRRGVTTESGGTMPVFTGYGDSETPDEVRPRRGADPIP